jgi:hypothetical protein
MRCACSASSRSIGYNWFNEFVARSDGGPMPAPESPTLHPVAERNFRRAKLRWSLSLATPIIYLFLAQLFRMQGWVEAPDPFAPAAQPPVWIAVGIAMIGCMIAIAVFRGRQREVAARLGATPDLALRAWMFQFHVEIMLADSIAFAALIYFMVSGLFEVMIPGVVLAHLAYAMAHPRREDLAGLGGLTEDEADD